jgi:hypothetical protein
MFDVGGCLDVQALHQRCIHGKVSVGWESGF